MWKPLADAITTTGTDAHIDCLIDLIGTVVAHDLITVTRYSASSTPEFVKHRRFSDEMVRKYLDRYYVYDPFYAWWRLERRLGILHLKRLTDAEMKRGQYIAEFLAQSKICDEVGILLEDGGDWCLGVFLDRSERPFRASEIRALEAAFPVFASLHSLDIKARQPGFMRTPGEAVRGASPEREPTIPADLWPSLSGRERELVQLVLSGHPTVAISQRLGITVGTVKNHRRRIYEKLDITTERELFLQFFQYQSR